MTLLYFARVREQIGRAEENITLPDNVRDLDGLLTWLASRGPAYAAALADRGRLRIAVNQAYARDNCAIGPDDEVALFPPVTGGTR